MSKFTTKSRASKSYAANTKSRATQQVAKGNLSSAAKANIVAKANKILGKTKIY